MRDWLQSYMRVGIVQFMAFPECGTGKGAIAEAVAKVVEDDFFSAIEITWIKDPAERQRVKRLLEASQMTVGYGAQPCLLSQKLNLNSFDPAERKRAVDQIKACADEAAEVGASALAILSGLDPAERRAEALAIFTDTCRELAGYCKARGLRLTVESFDWKYDKKALIGPARDALALAQALRPEFPDFGIMIDLSHLPIQDESPMQALGTLGAANLAHIHIGNCVKRVGHPLYGDLHPRFGVPGGENDVPQLTEFLQGLFRVGYLAADRRPVVAFEVKPYGDETPALVIANAKRTLTEAWARL